MNNQNTLTVATQYTEVSGLKFAYRRFGKAGSKLPLVFFQYFTGTMDNWDPVILDQLAEEREIIIFDNKGVAGSEGEPPLTIAEIAGDACNFIDALGLKRYDILGFSMGSYVAQQVALNRPGEVNRVILVGSAPRGGEGIDTFAPEVWALFEKTYNQPDEILLDTFFLPTTTSQKAGWAYLERTRAREEKDAALSELVIPAQVSAIAAWGEKYDGSFDYLKQLTQPVLVVHGSRDIIFPTINAYLLQQNLPDAQLLIYPDSSHAPHFQFPEHFVQQVKLFLNTERA